LEAGPKKRGLAAAPAPVPNAGTTAFALGASPGLEGARAAGSEGSSDPMRTEVSSVASAASPAAASSTAGGGVAASAKVISPASIGSASVAAAGLETAFTGTSGRTSSSALASLATDSNRGESRSSSARPESSPASSLCTLLLRWRSGVEVSASPDAEAGGGCVIRSMAMGDLRRRRLIVKSIRAAAANSGKKR
jgi:hypothetical protein